MTSIYFFFSEIIVFFFFFLFLTSHPAIIILSLQATLQFIFFFFDLCLVIKAILSVEEVWSFLMVQNYTLLYHMRVVIGSTNQITESQN